MTSIVLIPSLPLNALANCVNVDNINCGQTLHIYFPPESVISGLTYLQQVTDSICVGIVLLNTSLVS